MKKSALNSPQTTEHYLRVLLDNFPFMVWIKDKDSRLLAANAAYAAVVGASSPDALIGKTDFDFFPPEMAEEYIKGDQEAMLSDSPIGSVSQLKTAGGEYIWIEYFKSRVMEDGVLVGTLGYARDITDTIHKEREYHSLLENSPDLIVRYGPDLKRTYFNKKVADAYQVEPDFLLGKTIREYPGGWLADLLEEKIKTVFATGENTELSVDWTSDDGKNHRFNTLIAPQTDSEGKVIAAISMGRDVTETMEREERIHNLAYFDPLTGLPNRVLLNERVSQTIAEADRHGNHFGLMMIDLDRFKEINDSLGHAFGDTLLAEVANRIRAYIREYDMVARLGGDEFAILISRINRTEDLTQIANNLLKAFVAPFSISDNELFVTASIGIAVYPNDANSPDDLLKYADAAMYSAKSEGRNNFQYHSPLLTQKAIERHNFQNALHSAIQKEEFELYYQPLVDLSNGDIIGAEALIRWNRDDEVIPPNKFIGIAEETGLILQIGEWAFRAACEAAVKLKGMTSQPLKIAVNLSTRQFQDNDLIEQIIRTLSKTGCTADLIKIEITESLLLDDSQRIRQMLERLAQLGFYISIDDFGTGYSALSYLNNFPVSEIKIDRSFIQDINSNKQHALIVQAIVSLAKSLGKNIVAEGIETIEQINFLQGIECPQAQGFYFGKPVSMSEFSSYMSKWHS